MANVKEEATGLEMRWQEEKQSIDRLRVLNEEIEKLKMAAERSSREGDLEKAARIQYGELPEKQKQLKDAEEKIKQKGTATLLREEVTDEDIAKVVARWTGIPVTRLLESETSKLAHLED